MCTLAPAPAQAPAPAPFTQLPAPHLAFGPQPSAPSTTGSQAARVSRRSRSALWRTSRTPGTPSPGTQRPSSAPVCGGGRTERQPLQPRVPGVAAGPSPLGASGRPEVRLGRPRLLPQPAARSSCPAGPSPAPRGCGSRLPGPGPGPGRSGRGPSPERLAGASRPLTCTCTKEPR